MQRRIGKPIEAILPALVAVIVVVFEPLITAWSKGRASALPLAVCLLLYAMVHPRMRHLLIVTLCYGVAFLSLRDAQRMQRMPSLIDYDLIEEVRPVVLFLVAFLAAAAAVGETIRPGTVWARRCYFGAASLYFTGIGIINFGLHGSWQSVLLCITGVIAMFACVFAHQVVAYEPELSIAEEDSDEAKQREREVDHLRVLHAKEWQDTLPVPEILSTERDGGPFGPAVTPQ